MPSTRSSIPIAVVFSLCLELLENSSIYSSSGRLLSYQETE